MNEQPMGVPADEPAPVYLQMLNGAEFGEAAAGVFQANLKTLGLVTLCLLGPLQLIQLGVLLIAGDPLDFLVPGAAATDDNVAVAIVSLLLLIITPVAAAFVVDVATRVTAATYFGNRIPWLHALRTLGWRARPLLVVTLGFSFLLGVGASLLASLAGSGVLGLFLQFLYVVVLTTAFTAVIPGVVLEGLSPFEAVQKSFTLVGQRLAPTAGVMAASIVAVAVGYAVILVPFAVAADVAEVFSSALQAALLLLGDVAGKALVFPGLAIMATLLTFDLRIRYEGFDLDMLSRQLEASGGGTDRHDG